MELDGKKFWVGHDNANKKFTSSYMNNCEVRYFKYFNGAVCNNSEMDKHSDCSDDGCKELHEPGSCEEPAVEGNSPLDYTFKKEDKISTGSSFTIMGWINCVHAGGSWANIWHLSPTGKYMPR